MKPRRPADSTQRHAFIPAAKSIEADEDEKRRKARLKAVVKPSTKTPVKKGK